MDTTNSENISIIVPSISLGNISSTELKEQLTSKVARITFTKRDGTERIMLCTLQSNKIKPYEKKTDRVRVVNNEILSVWDIDADSWRSINTNTIKDIQWE